MSVQRSIKRLRDAPQKAIENARRGSLTDLNDLADFWQEVPELFPLGILDVFFHHLDAGKAFAVPSLANHRSPAANCAFASLAGLCKAGDYLLPGAPYHHDPAILKAWPGIFKWSAFLFAARVTSTALQSIEARRNTMDVISATWYCLTRADGLREAIAGTKGAIEIATQLWLLDEAVPHSGIPFFNVPSGAAALAAILVDSSAVDRALATAGGALDAIVKPAMGRARNALAHTPLQSAPVTIYLDLLGHLSRAWDHPLRYALLHAGAIPLCTRAAGSFARVLNAGGDPELLHAAVAAFMYLANCLESTDGFTWVLQSIAADVLLAFADFSPHLTRLDAEDCDMVCSLLHTILPKYLVYRSVVRAVEESMRRLGPTQLKRIDASVAQKVWVDFRRLAEERSLVVLQAVAVKGKAATCDNVKCHKVDAKNAFRKCSGCSTTLYCSKECQTVAWREGGHKNMCKMKQRERLEGKSQAIPKSDVDFFHHLATRDTRHHLPLLRRLARTEHPALRPGELIMRVDYTVVPPAYTVLPLADVQAHDMPAKGSGNAEARTDALLERARADPERFGLIQSRVVSGERMQEVLSVVTGDFWEDDLEGDATGATSEDEMGDTIVDDVDLMMARRALNMFLVNRGERPAF
ncbi:hypothetical protein B0H15DRAFT_830575 [Mycena belliarum]|uniref:MYND-type domain-containing protein n=1 Tax=Mycena belliarum TaxID=1033014 RepID=A0AAD6XRS5_9AGAR|nr:hypothetical protein B0H15DRAFT_830575 [Mycena belliae]